MLVGGEVEQRHVAHTARHYRNASHLTPHDAATLTFARCKVITITDPLHHPTTVPLYFFSYRSSFER